MKLSKKHIIFTLVIIFTVLIIVLLTPKDYFAKTSSDCSRIHSTSLEMRDNNRDLYMSKLDDRRKCVEKVTSGKTLFTFWRKKKITNDNTCDNEDPRLKSVCLFKKAYETGDHSYCYKQDPLDINSCLGTLSLLLLDEKICEHTENSEWCTDTVNLCKEEPDNWMCKQMSYNCDTIIYGKYWIDKCKEKYEY